MKKRFFRLLSVLLAAVLLLSALPAAADAPEKYAAHPMLCTPPYASGTAEVPVLVTTEDPARASLTESDIAAEILFFPFDAAAGLYASAGEAAGSRAEILRLSDDRHAYTVRLTEPGKYLLSGMPYYVLDPEAAPLAGLRAELEETVENSLGDTEKATAGKLHDWLCARVSPALPEDRADLAAACADPVNALLTGFALREAYAPLYRMLLQAAGIRSLVVTGQAGDEEASWNLCSLDGKWSWTDCALDDVKDKKQKKYLQLDDAKIAKDHTLSAADAAFADSMIHTSAANRFLDGTLPFPLTEPPINSDQQSELLFYDGPAIVVGDSATVTWHIAANHPVVYSGQDPAEYVIMNFLYYGWLDEDHYYSCSESDMAPEPAKAPKVSDLSELITVDAVADDLSSFTVTFRRPGMYSFWNNANFWLISPEQTELVSLAENINKAVESAASPTEKDTAKKLLKWLCGKVAYDYSFGETPRTMVGDYEAMTALLCGKTVCGGYAVTYNMLLQQAGILSFPISGTVRSGGHSWNLCRFDGVWSHTDPTWSDPGMKYFAMSPEQIRKDHEEYNRWITDHLFFSDSLSLWMSQFEAEYKPADYIPRALKTLPSSISGYGFPAQTPAFIRFTETDLNNTGCFTKIMMNTKAVRCDVFEVEIRDGAKEICGLCCGGAERMDSMSVLPRGMSLMKARAASYDYNSSLKKPAVLTTAYYRKGEWLSTAYEYLVPMKKNEIRGYTERSFRAFGYNEEQKPAWTAWHLENDAGKKEIRINFTADGAVDSYSVTVTAASGTDISWTCAADGTLQKLNGEEVQDPQAADPGAWEPLRFE